MTRNADTDGKAWVTFCMTTYNRPEFLKKQLTAISKQTFPNFHVVISDNASSDTTRQIVEEFHDARFFYYANGTNLGMVKSFNKSLERASSEFVAMLTDDDFIYPDMLQTLYDLYLAHPGYGMYMGGHDVFYAKRWLAQLAGTSIGTHSGLAPMELDETRSFDGMQFVTNYLGDKLGGGILWSAGVVKREIALSVGGVPDYGTPFLSDCSYVLLCGSKQGVAYVNKALAAISLHGENYSYVDSSYANLALIPDAFYQWTMERLDERFQTPGTRKLLEDYIGRSLTVYFVFLKKIFLQKKTTNSSFEESMKKVFRISYLRKWKLKYHVSSHYPASFQAFIHLRKVLLP